MARRRLAMRAGRARTLAALSVAGGLLAACNLLTGLDADYQMGDPTGRGEAGPTEGGEPDSAAFDAQTDAPASNDAGDGGLSFCESQRRGSKDEDFFCSDFENGVAGNGTPLGWMHAIDTFDGGSVKLTADAGIGGSHALDVTSGTAAISRQTRVYKELPRAKPTDQYVAYELDFDFRLVESTLDYDAYGLLVFEPQVKTKEHGIAGYSSGVDHKLARQAIAGNANPTQTVTNDPNMWHHASVRLTRGDAGTSFTRVIKVDTVDVDEVTTQHATEPSTITQLWLGVFNTSANNGRAHILFDNVVFRRQP